MKRLLLIGLGRWGTNHLRILKSMPIELFVADHDPKRLDEAEVPEDHRSTDPQSLFPRIDAAVVVTPAHAHFESCRELLNGRKDVFVEKPITLHLLHEKGRVQPTDEPYRAEPIHSFLPPCRVHP